MVGSGQCMGVSRVRVLVKHFDIASQAFRRDLSNISIDTYPHDVPLLTAR